MKILHNLKIQVLLWIFFISFKAQYVYQFPVIIFLNYHITDDYFYVILNNEYFLFSCVLI